MINKTFYKDNNLINEFLGGKMQHYPLRDSAIVIEHVPYTVQFGDSMYSLARKLFGDDGEANWTIIADINLLRQPDDLQPGEVIKLPIIIVSETRFNTPDYAKSTSATTKI